MPCPHCASTDARSLSFIYREGLALTETRWSHAAMNAGSAGDAASSVGAVSQTRSLSALSRAAAPPRKKNVIVWLLLSGGFAAYCLGSIREFGITTIATATAAVLGVSIAHAARRFNRTTFPDRFSRWQRSFRCDRCGNVFVT